MLSHNQANGGILRVQNVIDISIQMELPLITNVEEHPAIGYFTLCRSPDAIKSSVDSCSVAKKDFPAGLDAFPSNTKITNDTQYEPER